MKTLIKAFLAFLLSAVFAYITYTKIDEIVDRYNNMQDYCDMMLKQRTQERQEWRRIEELYIKALTQQAEDIKVLQKIIALDREQSEQPDPHHHELSDNK